MRTLADIKSMRNIPTSITRKLSSMPRSATCRKDYLELYVLAKEKGRMEQELEMLEAKSDVLIKNLKYISGKMTEHQEFVNKFMQVQRPPAPPVFPSQAALPPVSLPPSTASPPATQEGDRGSLEDHGSRSAAEQAAARKRGEAHVVQSSLRVRLDRRN